MLATGKFSLYLLVAYVLAALLCGVVGTELAQLTGAAPHKLIGRLGLLLALLGFWPWLRGQGLADREALGYGGPRRSLGRALGSGLALGVLMLGVLAWALLALNIRVAGRMPVDLDLGFAKVMVGGLAGGLAVGLIEETFFRGALFTAIRRRGGFATAALGSSLLYAAVHFFKPQPLSPAIPMDLASTLTSLAGAFPALVRIEHLDSLLALTLAGLLLALVRERSGHIVGCIGLHAGWVVVIRLVTHYSEVHPASPWAGLVGSYDGVIGWLAAAWLGLVGMALVWWGQASAGSPQPPKSGHRNSG